MPFIPLISTNQLENLDVNSNSRIQIIYKHSTRCSVSRMTEKIVTEEMNALLTQQTDVYYLDLLQFRSVSNEIASRYNITHESPQLLVIKDGDCIYHASHSDVSIQTAMLSIAG